MRSEKQSIVAEIKGELEGAAFILFTDFTKMNMTQTTLLRRKLRELDARLQVVPNRLFGVVAKELGYEGLEDLTKGPTALVYGSDDAAAAAKALTEFIKAEKVPAVKGGYMEGGVLDKAGVERLATLPSKKTLQGMFVATLAAPMSNLVGVFSQKLASVVYVLKAAADKKGEGAA